jgi:hypothetical protein
MLEVHQDLMIKSLKTISKWIQKDISNLKSFSPAIASLLKEIRSFQRIDPTINQLIRSEAFSEVFQTIEGVIKIGSTKLTEILSKSGYSASATQAKTQMETQLCRHSDDVDMMDDDVPFLDEEISRGWIF